MSMKSDVTIGFKNKPFYGYRRRQICYAVDCHKCGKYISFWKCFQLAIALKVQLSLYKHGQTLGFPGFIDNRNMKVARSGMTRLRGRGMKTEWIKALPPETISHITSWLRNRC